MDHQTITAERGRRAADLRTAAIAALEQQGIAAGMLLDLDDDTCVAAGPKAAILMLLNGPAPAVQVIDAPRVEDDEKRITAAARALSNRSADVCNVDREDNWTFYSEQYIEDARVALAAVDALPIARQAQPTDRDAVLEEVARTFDDSPHAEEFRCNIAAAIRALKSGGSTAEGAAHADQT